MARELYTGDELLLTEMMFTGDFNELKPSEAAALLSVFVFEEHVPIGKLSEKFSKCYNNLQVPPDLNVTISIPKLKFPQTHARRIINASKEFKLNMDEQKYMERFSAGMMDVVYRWCEGSTFENILGNTQLFEGLF